MERLLPLQKARNFRDLGGYAAAGGRRVKWRRLFRSGVMAYFTPDDILSALEGDGDAVTRIVGVGPGSEGFLIEGHGQAIVSLFFSGLPACQTAMSGAVP